MNCRVPNCRNAAEVLGICEEHRRRYVQRDASIRRFLLPGSGRDEPANYRARIAPVGTAPADLCLVPGCGVRRYARGLCMRHYKAYTTALPGESGQEARRYIRLPGERIARRDRTCHISGCREVAHARGLCKAHYMDDYYRRQIAQRSRSRRVGIGVASC